MSEQDLPGHACNGTVNPSIVIKQTETSKLNRFYWPSIIGLLLVHLILLINTQFTAWPEMLSYPYLINRGYSFYGDIIHPFVPLLVVILSFIYRLFGVSAVILRGLTLALILLTDLLLFYVAQKILGKVKSLVSLFIYLLLQVSFEGNGLWFDLAVVPIFITVLFTANQWFKKNDRLSATLTGGLLAIALLIKLSTLWLIGGLVLLGLINKRREAIVMVISISVTAAIVLLFLFLFTSMGSFSDFLFWAIYYPLFMIIRMPGYVQGPTFKQVLVVSLVSLPALVVAFLVFMENRWKGDKGNKGENEGEMISLGKTLPLLLLFFVTSLAFSLHRFAYFHFQPALPFLAMICGFVLGHRNKSEKLSRVFRSLSFVSLSFLMVFFIWVIARNWQKPTRFIEPEVVKVSYQLSQKLPNDQPIFFYNLPSQYFVLASLLPVKPWVDIFPWYLELPGLQKKIINNFERENVQWVVFFSFLQGGRFDLGSYQPELLNEYVRENFHTKESIDRSILILQRDRR